jgi:hypothetical protein
MLASNKDEAEKFALMLSDEQFLSYKKQWESAPVLPAAREPRRGHDEPLGHDDPLGRQHAAGGRRALHRRGDGQELPLGGMSEEQVKQTPSYAKLVAAGKAPPQGLTPPPLQEREREDKRHGQLHQGRRASATPFGKNQFLRSTRDLKVESYTLAAATVPSKTIDGWAGPEDPAAGHRPGQDHLRRRLGQGRSVPGGAATDGRQTLANIVGLNRTFLPWQTIERDVEVGVVYECAAVQGWCIELDAAGNLDRPDGHHGCRP